jgi:MFS transporter, DHA2 family, methylenomycin A resistance protein
VALALGPVVGGLLVARFGWQSIFFLNLPIGAATLAIALRVVPESRHPEGRTLDLPGQALAAVALGTATYALIQANSNGWTSPLTIGLLAAAALAQAAFLLVESRSPSPMLQLGFFRSRAFAAGVSIAGLVSFGTFGALFFLTLYIQNVQGYSALGMGVRALPLTCAIIVTAPLAGRMAGRIGSRVPLTLGLVLNAAGMLLLLRLTPTTSYGTLWWDLFMLGVGVGLVATPMTAAVMSAVPRARAGMASATTNASREIGGVFGVALLGAFMSRFYASGLSSRLGSLAGSAEAKARIASLARRGGQLAGASFPGVSARQLHTIVGQAFVAGMRPAIAVAGGALLIGAVVAAVFVPSGVPAVEVPAEGAAAPSAETEAALAGRPGAGAPGRRKTGAEKEAA